MKVTIESPFTLSDQDKKFINDKIKDLEKYESRMTQVNVFFKKGDGKIPNAILSEIQIRVPGNDLFAGDTDKSAIKSFSSTFNTIKKLLKKRRSKVNDHQSPVKEISDIVNDNT